MQTELAPIKHRIWPHYLWLLMLVYVLALIVANWFDARLIAVGPFVTDAGTIIFPVTLLFVI